MSQVKKICLQLAGLNGNAFSLMGAFSAQAREEGWTQEEIDAACQEATSGDYNHLLRTLASRCEDPVGEE